MPKKVTLALLEPSTACSCIRSIQERAVEASQHRQKQLVNRTLDFVPNWDKIASELERRNMIARIKELFCEPPVEYEIIVPSRSRMIAAMISTLIGAMTLTLIFVGIPSPIAYGTAFVCQFIIPAILLGKMYSSRPPYTVKTFVATIPFAIIGTCLPKLPPPVNAVCFAILSWAIAVFMIRGLYRLESKRPRLALSK